MFNIDKKRIKKQLRDKVESSLPYYYGTHSSGHNVVQVNHNELENFIRKIAHEEARKIIQLSIPDIIDNLVDSLYTYSEFEQDIGLTNQ